MMKVSPLFAVYAVPFEPGHVDGVAVGDTVAVLETAVEFEISLGVLLAAVENVDDAVELLDAILVPRVEFEGRGLGLERLLPNPELDVNEGRLLTGTRDPLVAEVVPTKPKESELDDAGNEDTEADCALRVPTALMGTDDDDIDSPEDVDEREKALGALLRPEEGKKSLDSDAFDALAKMGRVDIVEAAVGPDDNGGGDNEMG
jgi:hypothetical protein